jgi:acetolactate synthase-1/2/3 large subunit
VFADVVVDKVENCFPMIPSGSAHNDMILGPVDRQNREVSEAGKALV